MSAKTAAERAAEEYSGCTEYRMNHTPLSAVDYDRTLQAKYCQRQAFLAGTQWLLEQARGKQFRLSGTATKAVFVADLEKEVEGE